MTNTTWCNGVGPFQAMCEREANHDGEHEGHDAHGYIYRWLEADYPSSSEHFHGLPSDKE